MSKFCIFCLVALASAGQHLTAQSRHAPTFSESNSRYERAALPTAKILTKDDANGEVIKVETDLVTIPVRISDKLGRPVPDIKREEFRVFENDEEQEIAYFSTQEAPFTVALMLDMSYSSVFKLTEIQDAALAFVRQLREQDKVMVISFDERAQILCEPTNNKEVLRLAIEGAKIASGTSLYSALDLVLNEKFNKIKGRKAIVLLSDGVDTTSRLATAKGIAKDISETEAIIYPIQYDTFDDVQKNRRKDAEIRYDDNDRPYVVDSPRGLGERASDYQSADEFLNSVALQTGGRVQRVSSNTNLNKAFALIADELRKTYSLGYYPSSERKPGGKYSIKVRVYRPNLNIRTKESSISLKN